MRTWCIWWKRSGLTGRITGKPGISKGSQILITIDVSRILSQFYVHCHKIHKRPPGFVTEGQNEARMLCENITLLIVGEEQQPGVNQIFKSKPHFTFDNYFSGDLIMNYLGNNGYGDVMTCLWDCLTSNIPPQYFYKLKTDSKQQSKEARFLYPVLSVKETYVQGGKQAYQGLLCL